MRAALLNIDSSCGDQADALADRRRKCTECLQGLRNPDVDAKGNDAKANKRKKCNNAYRQQRHTSSYQLPLSGGAFVSDVASVKPKATLTLQTLMYLDGISGRVAEDIVATSAT